MPFYAVARGRQTGIFDSWSKAQSLVSGYSRAVYKKFPDYNSAARFCDDFMNNNHDGPQRKKPRSQQTNQPPPAQIIRKNNHVPTVETARQIKSAEARASEIIQVLKNKDLISHQMLDPNHLAPRSIHVVPRIGIYDILKLSDRDLRSKVDFSQLPMCQVYCDGASRGNGSSMAISGYGVFFNNYELPFSAAVPFRPNFAERATNQSLELLAIKDALFGIWKYYARCVRDEVVPEFQFTIFSDSQYSINCLTSWCNAWKKNGWKNSKGEAVVHKDIIEQCLRYMKALQEYLGSPIEFQHVKGHAGNLGNTVADQLANMACDILEDHERAPPMFFLGYAVETPY